MAQDDLDVELDPNKIRFGMSRKEREELEADEKRKKKKLPKNWRSQVHWITYLAVHRKNALSASQLFEIENAPKRIVIAISAPIKL